MVGPRLHRQPHAARARRLVLALRLLELGPARRLRGVQQPLAMLLRQELAHDPVVGAVWLLRVLPLPQPFERGQLAEARRRLPRLCARVDAGSEVAQGVEAALHEPALVDLRVEGPGSAQHDQLHLLDRMPDLAIGRQAVPGLEVGIEAVVLGALRAGLVGDVALRQAQVARAEDALARARVGLRQHRHGGDTRERPHRTHAQLRQEGGLRQPPARLAPEMAEALDDLALREEAAALAGMALHHAVDAAGVELRQRHQRVDQGRELPLVRSGIKLVRTPARSGHGDVSSRGRLLYRTAEDASRGRTDPARAQRDQPRLLPRRRRGVQRHARPPLARLDAAGRARRQRKAPRAARGSRRGLRQRALRLLPGRAAARASLPGPRRQRRAARRSPAPAARSAPPPSSGSSTSWSRASTPAWASAASRSWP